MFPLRLIKNTLFSCNKNVYYNQISYLKLYFGPSNKAIYQGNVAGHPAAGVLAWAGGAITIANLQLFLAIESNEQQRSSLINQVLSTGLTRYIPWVQSYKNSQAAQATQNITIQFDVGSGASLAKVIHSVFNNNDALDVAYDNSNTDTPGLASQKVRQYYTMLNGRRLQDITLDCTAVGNYTDYTNQKKFLRETCLLNREIFQYNWFHCDDFCQFGNKYDQSNNNELLGGIPLGGNSTSQTWSFVGTNMSITAFQHYTFAVFNRRLIIDARGGRLE